MSSQPFIAILGPTASGKSLLAMAVAESELGRAMGVELLSVDAMQVYRGMDIGTAKPSLADRQSVRHHLIDLVDPQETFTVAQFQSAHRVAMTDMENRGGCAVAVGGTGLYVRAIVDALSFPGQWPIIRAELERRVEKGEVAELHAQLRELDPLAASKMEPSNARRIVRALEVVLGSGRSFSSFGPGVDAYPPTPVRQFALQWPRHVLAARIEQRVESMMSSGLVHEVERLLNVGMSPTARQALGYKEIIDHVAGRSTLDEATALIIRRTRQFAVRQERWFRRDPRIIWLAVESDPVPEALPRLLEEFRAP